MQSLLSVLDTVSIKEIPHLDSRLANLSRLLAAKSLYTAHLHVRVEAFVEQYNQIVSAYTNMICDWCT